MDDESLVCAYALDGSGGGRALGWAGIDGWREQDGPLWLHFDRRGSETRRWLTEASGLSPVVADALLAEETRPRCEPFEDGILLILRGVNLNPGAEPEDMIALRIWIDGRRVITTRARRLLAAQELRERLEAGRGPADVSGLLVATASALIARMGPVIDDLDDQADVLEDQVITQHDASLRGRLVHLRREAIALRRYLAPQREALSRLQAEQPDWLSARERIGLREVQDRTVRYLEDLDSIRERAGVVQDELANRLSERMNRTMYVLTVVATIMLPLGFITGLLGVNVGGIPGQENPHGFIALSGLLALLVVVQLIVFRRLRWL